MSQNILLLTIRSLIIGKNNFQNLKKNISCLENQVLLDKIHLVQKATLKNRSDFIKTFIQTESSGELCGVGIDIRLLTDCFNEVKKFLILKFSIMSGTI